MYKRWLGFLLMNVGEIGNFISYAWAPASVVAPLGTVRNHIYISVVIHSHSFVSFLLWRIVSLLPSSWGNDFAV